MMKKYFYKSALVFCVFTFLVFVSLGKAANYSTTFSFDTTVTGPTRWFEGNNIAFEAPEAKSSPFVHYTNFTYTVTLYRYNSWWGRDKIGSAVLPRDSWGKVTWSNVGPGNYYIYLSKAFDGVKLTDNNAKIYNY